MFGGSSSPPKEKTDPIAPPTTSPAAARANDTEDPANREGKNFSRDLLKRSNDKRDQNGDKKRRGSSVSKAAAFLASAKNSLHISSLREPQKPVQVVQTPLQILGKMDPALVVPQGSLNNSAGESLPTPRSSFRVGVTEDKNKKCRRTMEDTHAYLYNFLGKPISTSQVESSSQSGQPNEPGRSEAGELMPMIETDNGYFAIFDGHAGTFAAEWCGKKLHLILEETIRKNPNTPLPMLLDQTFTLVDQQLEQLPMRNSGCTAVTAVLRWEDRVINSTVSASDAANNKVQSPEAEGEKGETQRIQNNPASEMSSNTDLKTASTPNSENTVSRQRVLYTANVGDARIILCRNGKALRLSYDHKGSDENEGMRITNAGGLILNNRVNGVLAVTRALGDSYMKDLVTGHPFTTETVIQPETDEFLILACDGLWDVCSDQEAVDLVRDTDDPQEASKILVDHALSRFSTDNLSCMVVRFDTKAQGDGIGSKRAAEGEVSDTTGVSETDRIMAQAEKEAKRRSISNSDTGVKEEDRNAQAEALAAKLDEEPGPEITLPEKSKNGDIMSPTSPSEGTSAPDKGSRSTTE
ncbi:mgpp2cl-1, protein phosphatase 2C-like protein 1 [Emydomyces testavorans]|uniref:Mgpp2cl-1, protein phosphatase 2C-like protein 1 n=1 Tax=Emydomyces testavorans TaxID=2070801 RepID=A0AAF0IKZ1_9EURO|nr:mgpp2cl-1, protein phosphatase 2C-like protein 1 [Emydomyces testavorans]